MIWATIFLYGGMNVDFPPLPTPDLLEKQQTDVKPGRDFLKLLAKSGWITRSRRSDRVEVSIHT